MRIEIPLKLPSLNDYIKVCRANKFQASNYKADIETQIGYYLLKLPKFKNPIKIHFTWIEGNKKRDFDNICFSKKFILDAMVRIGKLKDDNRKYVVGFTDTFEYGDEFKVILDIAEVKNSE